jgi:heme/copper-type cytochrome/quinol oxidase subunit 2
MSLETPERVPFTFVFKKEYLIGVAVVVLAVIPSIYFYRQYSQAQKRLSNPSQFAGEEVKNLVVTVGKLMTLPGDETPTVATVNDKEKLKNQPFFAHAENGDKVLIYTTSKKAILFRPTLNKIIDVAPVNIGGGAQATATASAQTTPASATVTFELLNGTTVVGMTKSYETALLAKVKNAKVTNRDNAKRTNYEKSLLVDVKGTQPADAKTLSTELGLELSPLPVGEATPTADFLIILGADKK